MKTSDSPAKNCATPRPGSGAARDFNALINIARANLSDLLSNPKINADQSLHESVAGTDEAIGKVEALLHHALGLPLGSGQKKSKVESRGVIDQTIRQFSANLPDTFQVFADVKEDIWPFHGDKSQIEQVLFTIFENARHATNGTGQINLTARNFVLYDRAMSEAFECNPGHYVIITIADDGPGIAENLREKVFEPNFTGNGLSNARAIVHHHGGHITCTSSAGQGTAFSLYLPRHRVAGKSEQNFKSDRVQHTGKQNPGVLVVEDEAWLRNLVRTYCERNGYRTFGAADGVEALELINKNPDDILVAILDLAMPRMTGNELFKQLNAAGFKLPVIVASGFLIDADKFVEETGGTPYAIFSKPFQLSELIAKINEIRDQAGLAIAP